MRRRGDAVDIAAGLLFAGLGALGALGSTSYSLGTARELGPGAVPLVLFAVMGVLGLVIGLRGAWATAASLPPVAWRPLALVLLAAVAFAALLRSAGFAVATLVLVVISSLGARAVRPLEALAAGIVLALFGTLVFGLGLGVPLPLWPWSD